MTVLIVIAVLVLLFSHLLAFVIGDLVGMKRQIRSCEEQMHHWRPEQ